MTGDYVHGYSAPEGIRLFDQASTLCELLHGDTRYAAGSSVLEVGCGVGAQSVILARNSPQARFTSIDISSESVRQARERIRDADIPNVTFRQADIFDLPFRNGSFDHIFVCFVLEHLDDPEKALANLRLMLKPGGSMTVIEGDHGSAFFHPEGAAARRAIESLIALQARTGGDALIGRRLFPLLTKAGFSAVTVSPRMVYVDASRPSLVDGFTKKIFMAMIEGVRERVLSLGLMEPHSWRQGIEELRRTTEADGVFCYTFFKAVARASACPLSHG
jgi:SAM-dependent methyltransferase